MLNRALFALGAILAVGAPVTGIVQKELLLRNGRKVVLELAPADPRSLMQGDYMAVGYAIGGMLAGANRNGMLVLRDDAQGVGRFVRLDTGGLLEPGEYRLRFRRRGGRTVIGGNSYFFQEGTGGTYAQARFGELRCGGDGEVLLVGLLDQDGKALGKEYLGFQMPPNTP